MTNYNNDHQLQQFNYNYHKEFSLTIENIPDTSDIINDVNNYDDPTNITDLYNNITDNDDLLAINAFDIRAKKNRENNAAVHYIKCEMSKRFSDDELSQGRFRGSQCLYNSSPNEMMTLSPG